MLTETIPNKINNVPKIPISPKLSFKNILPKTVALAGLTAQNNPARSEVV